MPHDPDKCLYDVLDSCRFLLEFTAGRTLNEFRNDRGFRSAVERELQIIGEAIAVLLRMAPDIAAQVSEHERIIRFRHILVHGYDILDDDITWAIVQDKLPILKEEVERALES